MQTNIKDKVLISLIVILIFFGISILYRFYLGQFSEHKDGVNSIQLSNSDKIISTSDNEFFIWNNRNCIKKIKICDENISDATISSNKKYIAIACGNSIKVISFESEKLLKEIHLNSRIRKLNFDSTGEILITLNTNFQIEIINWTKNKTLKTLDSKSPFSIKNDKIVYIYEDNLNIFNLKNSELLKIPNFDGIPILSNDTKYIAVKNFQNSSFKIVNTKSQKTVSTFNIFNSNNKKEVDYFKFSLNNEFLAMGIWGGDIEIWNWKNKKLVTILRGHILSSVNGIEFNSKNELISASGDKSIKIWDWQDNKLINTLGNGDFLYMNLSILIVILYISICISFLILISNNKSNVAKTFLLLFFTIISLGIAYALYFLRKKSNKNYDILLVTFSSILTFLFFISIWFSFLSYYTIILALILCYILILQNDKSVKINFLTVINLLYLGLLCFFYVNKDF